MKKADEALEAKRGDRPEAARSLFREACKLESEAALTLLEDTEAEPTRSVLFRSAASLAINGDLPAHAAYLIACGLEGSPPIEIREELRSLLSALRAGFAPSDKVFGADERVGDHLNRALTSYADLSSGMDEIRKTLAQTDLVGARLANSLVQQILTTTRDALRRLTGDQRLALDLFGVGSGEGDKWVSIALPQPVLPDDWLMPAKNFVWEQEDSLLSGRTIVGRVENLATEGILSADDVEALRRVEIRSLSASPVRAMDDQQTEHAALTLLALACNATAFADDLTNQVLENCASLLSLALQIGQRDDCRVKGSAPVRNGESWPSAD
jgi:hypothetical protein